MWAIFFVALQSDFMLTNISLDGSLVLLCSRTVTVSFQDESSPEQSSEAFQSGHASYISKELMDILKHSCNF